MEVGTEYFSLRRAKLDLHMLALYPELTTPELNKRCRKAIVVFRALLKLALVIVILTIF